MITMYHWLIEEKNYTEAEAEETVFRWDNRMVMPEKVENDVKTYLWLKYHELLRRPN